VGSIGWNRTNILPVYAIVIGFIITYQQMSAVLFKKSLV